MQTTNKNPIANPNTIAFSLGFIIYFLSDLT